MNRLPVARVVLSVSIVAATMALTGAAGSDEWPTRWRVNGNGVTGTLEFSIGEGGLLTGRVLDDAVEGYVNGRHLVLRRVRDNRSEVWEGWLGQPAGEGSSVILAGTISVAEFGHTQVYPWFGTLEPSSPVSSPVPPAAVATTAAAAETVPTEQSEQESSGDGLLTGKWDVTEGQAEIVQDGKNLTVLLPDGSSHSGRMTGGDTLIVGLRKGCCNGELEGLDVIVWSDGARWRRAD